MQSEEGTTRIRDSVAVGQTAPLEVHGNENNPNEPANTGTQHLGGQGERAIHDEHKVSSMVKIEIVVERFRTNTRLRLKESVQRQYTSKFRVFAKKVDLEKYDSRQLAGAKGKALLMKYLEGVPKPSWRNSVNLIKGVWTYGTNIAFPLDLKRDLGKLPHVQRGQTPSDDVIKTWNEAMKHDPDTYSRLRWHLFGMGLRPSHLARLKWRNIQYDPTGKPTSIYADGSKENFKTRSPVAFRLHPILSDLISKWAKESPDTYPEHFIIPWRALDGTLTPGRELELYQSFNLWVQTRNKWKLPNLRPRDVRHWVSTTARKHGLSKQATAYMQGHDSAGDGMRNYYDNPELTDIYDEQGAIFPGGPLATLDPIEVRVIEGLPDDVIDLVRAYMEGRTGTMEFATKMELLRSRQMKPLSAEIPSK